MERGLATLLLFAFLLGSATAFPLCINNLEAPGPSSANLTFCTAPEYKAQGCCSVQYDSQLASSFNSLNISDPNCAAVVKQILCSKCDAYSADLYGVEASQQRGVPYLCSNGTNSYCSQVWNACSNVSITNSPFDPSLLGGTNSSVTKAGVALDNLYNTETDFCTRLGPSTAAGNFCFDGTPFKVPAAGPYTPPEGICLEKVVNASDGMYLNLVPHPDKSKRAFLSTQNGYVFLANISGPSSGQAFSLDFSAPFLNLTSRIRVDNELGMMGLAFHPNFVNNGRFFVSYDCDTHNVSDCTAQCGCSPANGCNVAAIGPEACRYSAIVAEYTVNASGVSPAMAVSANPTEVRRIFSLGLPYKNHHAGSLYFGPVDKYLYLPMGDGGGTGGDIWNNAQNRNLLLGKMIRLDIDDLPSPQQITSLGLIGNYSVPSTNPFVGVNGTRGEVWAYGLRNPWRCSFDSQHPSYFYCGDVGQSNYEEVDLISKGGNYGWRVYEGTHPFKPASAPGGYTNPNSINALMPIIEYNHTINPKGSAAVIGGFVSYSTQDACAYGKYVYGDYLGPMWVAAERPAFSGVYTVSDLPYKCSPSSPLECITAANGNVQLNTTIAYAEDNNNDLYVLGGNGVYRLVSPSLCNITCSQAVPVSSLSPTPAPAPSGQNSSALSLGAVFQTSAFCFALVIYVLLWL